MNVNIVVNADKAPTTTVSGGRGSGFTNSELSGLRFSFDSWNGANKWGAGFQPDFSGSPKAIYVAQSYRPVSQNVTLTGDKYGGTIEFPVRVTNFKIQYDIIGTLTANGGAATCTTQLGWGGTLSTDDYSKSSCRSTAINSYYYGPGGTNTYGNNVLLDLNYFSGGISALLRDNKIKIYTYNGLALMRFCLIQSQNFIENCHIVNVSFSIKIENRINEISLPTMMIFDVSYINGRTIGKAKIQGNINGDLQRITVTPRSSQGGSLSLGETKIPYSMDIIALRTNDIRSLIKSGVVATPVIFTQINGDDAMNFPIAIDANFDIPTNQLQNGLYTDVVTLMFSTSI
ncbi:hypothetical protein H8I69_06060 [Serratia fonticola]|uniref:hypothetical protein n=1 Tax=Serratia fonticola TaxID=47917 RepID=UPI0015C6264D|nr:hypothetical protein [Serratia fonticola]MBC3378681.1 hypothetical protein [Serratia fonticola]NYA37881.1 hypothetical protein [Serratia fonticola]